MRVQLARCLSGQARNGLELLAGGGDDGLRRAEVVEQRPLARRPDAGQLVEQRRGHRAVAPRAVMRYREAVRLVADALEELQRRRVVAEHDRLAPSRHEDLLDAL